MAVEMRSKVVVVGHGLSKTLSWSSTFVHIAHIRRVFYPASRSMSARTLARSHLNVMCAKQLLPNSNILRLMSTRTQARDHIYATIVALGSKAMAR